MHTGTVVTPWEVFKNHPDSSLDGSIHGERDIFLVQRQGNTLPDLSSTWASILLAMSVFSKSVTHTHTHTWTHRCGRLQDRDAHLTPTRDKRVPQGTAPLTWSGTWASKSFLPNPRPRRPWAQRPPGHPTRKVKGRGL